MSFLNGPKSFLFSGEASGNKLATPEAVNRIITIYFLRRLPRHFFFFFFFYKFWKERRLHSLSKHCSQTVCVAPHSFTTPSPGGHSWQHSPPSVYWPDSHGASSDRSILDAQASATCWNAAEGQKGATISHKIMTAGLRGGNASPCTPPGFKMSPDL